jgi:NAD(P)-dependent dehydrogenase (short-subunit alcohol dehydrogenase family)
MMDLMSVESRVAFVTGASSGLGAHFARTLARHGAHVILAARRPLATISASSAFNRSTRRAHAVALDVADAASVDAAIAAGEQALGPLSILINNAGVSGQARFTDATEADWRDVMAVNLDGVFRVGQAAARRMMAHGHGGSIVNIASIIAFSTMKQLAAYGASKAAVVSLTKSMALELASARIRVNAIAPGYFSTEINESFWATDAGKAMIKRIPQRRLGQYQDLDGPLLLLASDAGAFMTGSVVVVDGGHLLSSV